MDILTSLQRRELEDIAEDILLLLDAKSLFIAECVCKEWREIIISRKLWLRVIRNTVRRDERWAKVVQFLGWDRYFFNLNPQKMYRHTFYKRIHPLLSRCVIVLRFDCDEISGIKKLNRLFPAMYRIASQFQDYLAFGFNDGSIVITRFFRRDYRVVLYDRRFTAQPSALLVYFKTVYSGTSSGRILVWNTRSASIVNQLSVQRASITEIVAVAGMMAVASLDGYVSVWDRKSALNITLRSLIFIGVGRVNCLTLTPEFIAASNSKSIKVWTHPMYTTAPRSFTAHKGTVTCLHYFRGYLASGSHDNRIAIWDLNSGNLLRVLVGHESRLASVFFGRRIFYSISIDGVAKSWKIRDFIDEQFTIHDFTDTSLSTYNRCVVHAVAVYVNKLRGKM